jgi:hypothetical protein
MQNDNGKWHEVISPKITKQRTLICCSKRRPVNMFVISKKLDTVPTILNLYQSDYVNMWNSNVQKVQYQNSISKIKILYRKIVPEKIRNLRYKILDLVNYKSRYLQYYKSVPEFTKQRKKDIVSEVKE